jgi:hypothetical protein
VSNEAFRVSGRCRRNDRGVGRISRFGGARGWFIGGAVQAHPGAGRGAFRLAERAIPRSSVSQQWGKLALLRHIEGREVGIGRSFRCGRPGGNQCHCGRRETHFYEKSTPLHINRLRRRIVVSNLANPAGSVAVAARPTLPNTRSTSGKRIRIRSVAVATGMPCRAPVRAMPRACTEDPPRRAAA